MTDWILKLKQSPEYHGQILRAKKYEENIGEKVTEFDKFGLNDPLIDEFHYFMEFDGFYKYQINVWKNLLRGNNVYLTGEPFSGKSITIFISIMLSLLRTGRTSLFLTKPTILHQEFESFSKLLKKTKWKNIISANIALDEASLNVIIQEHSPQTIFTTPEVLLKFFTSGIDDVYQSTFFRNLGFLGIDNIQTYHYEELIHFKYLLRLLLSFPNEEPHFLIAGIEVKSTNAFIFNLCGDIQPVTIKTEHLDKPAYSVIHWLPPILRKEDSNDYSEFERRGVFDELHSILEIIDTNITENETDILVWNMSTYGNIEEPVTNNINLSVINDLTSLSHKSTFDIIITLGFPTGYGELESFIGNLLSDGGLHIILPVDDPLSHAALRIPELGKIIGYQETILPDHPRLLEEYLLLCLRLVKKRAMDRDKFMSYWGTVKSVIEKYLTSGIIAEDKDANLVSFNYIDQFSLPGSSLRWGVVGENLMYINNYGYIDSEKLKFDAFPGAILNKDGAKYLITHRDGVNAEVAPTGAPVVSRPIIDIEVGKIPDKSIDRFEGHNATIDLYEFEDVKVATNKYIPEKSDISTLLADAVKFSPPMIDSYESYPAIKITNIDSHLFLHIWLIYIEPLIKGVSESIYPKILDGCLYLFPKTTSFHSTLYYLYNHWNLISDIIDRVVKLAFLSDPSYEPSPHSLLTNQCIHCREQSLEENVKAKFLIEKYETDEDIFTLMEFKKRPIEDQNFVYSKAQMWKKYILSLFEDKFDIQIDSPVPLQVKAESELGKSGIRGYYSPGDSVIVIRKNENERGFIEVIAHEYGHNWENEHMSNAVVLQDSTLGEHLISEGFAQWLSFKICDFFGLRDEIEAIDFVDIDRGGDEYGWGFKIVYWIEENLGGLQGVIQFLESGTVNDSDGNAVDISEIIKMTGWEKELEQSISHYN